MFSIRATRRSHDIAGARRHEPTERVHLLWVESATSPSPDSYYAELGFRPPVD